MESRYYSEMSLLLRLVDRTKVKNGFLEAIYLNRGHTKTVSVTIPVFRNKRNVDFQRFIFQTSSTEKNAFFIE